MLSHLEFKVVQPAQDSLEQAVHEWLREALFFIGASWYTNRKDFKTVYEVSGKLKLRWLFSHNRVSAAIEQAERHSNWMGSYSIGDKDPFVLDCNRHDDTDIVEGIVTTYLPNIEIVQCLYCGNRFGNSWIEGKWSCDACSLDFADKPKNRAGFVYIFGCTETGYYKIGCGNTPTSRMKDYERAKLPFPVQMLHTIPADDKERAEAELHLPAFDIVLTDPPYGINGSSGKINKARNKGGYTADFRDNPEYIKDVIVPTVKALISMCNCVVLTPGNKNFSLYPQPDSFGCFFQPAAAGLQVFGNLDAQPIFYYGKNASKKNMGVPCSYQLTEAPEKNGHPCVKPIEAWKKLLANISLPGQMVLDPFMGSGTTVQAAQILNRRAIGIEISEEYCRIAVDRLRQPNMFSLPNIAPIIQPTQAAMELA